MTVIYSLFSHPNADGTTTICLNGCEISVPPACFTNSSGEKELPWHTQTMLISAFVYLYKKPVMVFPFGPFPVVETRGIWGRESEGDDHFWFSSSSPPRLAGKELIGVLLIVDSFGFGLLRPGPGVPFSNGWSAAAPAVGSGLVGQDWAVFASTFSVASSSTAWTGESFWLVEVLCSSCNWPLHASETCNRVGGNGERVDWLLESLLMLPPAAIDADYHYMLVRTDC